MFTKQFGLEIEFTGITREKAAETAAHYLSGTISATGDYYDTQKVTASDGRIWKLMYDGSINCQKKDRWRTVSAGSTYSVELVSPILSYREDIGTVQALARRLRKAGGFANKSCGIHIHLDGASHTPRSIRNFVNIIYAHNDLLYKSLQIAPERMRYCKKMDAYLVERMNQVKPKTLKQIESIWYENYGGSHNNHYHQSRYHFLNLHSFFHGNHTVELRGFNSTLHAGKIRAYIVLALALNHQALTQKSASCRKVQEENEKFAMRVWLNRIGFIGEEFKSCREHLYQHLDGNAAWRYGSKENVRSHINTRNTENGGS
ncbi:amidoligase family protein [Lachnospiraceae bacterium 45-W7]